MLQETNKALINLKEKNKLVAIKKAKRKYLYNLYKKYLLKLLFIFIIIWIFIFPIHAGTVLGTWIQQFFGTIYHIVYQSVR